MDCPGDYPNNVTCTDGHCEFGECASDDDCAIFMNDAYACTAVSGFSGCFAICASDDDCTAGVTTCTGVTDDGQMFCDLPGCMSDDDCFGFGVCNMDTGDCGCASDDDCSAENTVCV